MGHLRQLTSAALLAMSATPVLADQYPRIEGTKTQAAATAVQDLVYTLDAWLNAYSDYHETDRALKVVRLVEPGFKLDHDGRSTILEGNLRGAYIDENATIYLVQPWFPDHPADQSVLLHELVHHRQVNAKHWYCEQAMEWDAYKLQEEFLAALGQEAGFHWASIVLASSCTVRDHHPD